MQIPVKTLPINIKLQIPVKTLPININLQLKCGGEKSNKSETVEEFVDIQHSKCPSDKSQQQQLQEIPVTASAESNYEFQQTLQIQKGNQIKFICPVEHRTITKCQRKPKPVPKQSLPASNCSVFYCSEGCFQLSGDFGNSFMA